MVQNEKIDDEISYLHRVEKKAHEFYERRGREQGHDWQDWFEAERIIEKRTSPVEKDCIRSEVFYELSHRAMEIPSEMDTRKKLT